MPSNICFAPINPGFSKNGVISNRYFDFYNTHSGRGIGICYVGNVAIKEEWTSNNNTAVLSSTPEKSWKNLTVLIANNGSVPGLQLAWKPPTMVLQKRFKTNNLSSQIFHFKDFYNCFEDYENVASLFVESIKKAADYGFPVIQLHAAHGYALSLLLSRSISDCNTPSDTKGLRLIERIVNGLNRDNIILDIRLSLYEGIGDNQDELEYKSDLITQLEHFGFDIISFSNGFYNVNKTMIYPVKNGTLPIFTEAKQFAEIHNGIVHNVAGNLEYALMNGHQFPDNLMISLGRQLLADPATVEKMIKQNYDTILKCTECNACHYYSFNYNGIQVCNL